ncbi:MAG: general secretion pathway protein GspK [Bdellovibrionales bacterium]
MAIQRPNRSPKPAPISKILRSQRGVALLLALFAMTLLTFIAVEVSYDTAVDYVVASQQVNRIKAYYAAKAGVELSLLRVSLYKQAVSALGSTLGPQVNMLDPIWSFPFMWPPTAMEAALTEVDKGLMQDAVKESFMSAQYATTITPESGRIDINDLGSDVKVLKQSMIQQVIKIFRTEVENNEEFERKYSGTRWEELVHKIADYIDEDQESLNGGDESADYRDVEDSEIKLPPNRPLRTVEELHQVAGMTDDFYNVLAPRVTVFGTKGININYADKDVLMSLDVTVTEEVVNKVIARRSNPDEGGPFKDKEDFFAFVQNLGVNTQAIEESKVPLLFGQEFNFRIVSTGVSGIVKREITAITYDYEALTEPFAKLLDEQDSKDKSTGPETSDPNDPDKDKDKNPDPNKDKDKAKDDSANKDKQKSAGGRPTVVYWEEN